MNTKLKALTAAIALGLPALALGTGPAAADELAEGKWGEYQAGDKRSGYTYAGAETRAMQDDEFQNPAMLWLDTGMSEWEAAAGDAGKACADCHGDAEESMTGVATKYPVYSEETGKMMNLEQRINFCRTENMQAEPYKWESDELLGMTAYVKNQSKGMPVDVSIDGPAKEFWEKGKEFYETRRGQLDLACTHCHIDNAGNVIRAETLSQGQGNGFPLYRLKWQKVGSLHRRFRGCNNNIRADKLPYGSDEYTNLELYVTWRGNGLPIETPAVRK
ncbi:sulfur oxidation c-type cytochrome SoxA [Caenispirillum salinarum]|uniref:sulfur oxidation c-type cytochrome SoxA n=1 Tax=Caenispirillum salinarum TaxID=859058 RepID=UPI00384CB072